MIKWLGSVVIIISMMFTIFDMYPYNVYSALVGSALWVYVAVKSRDNALLLMNLVAFGIYIFGTLMIMLK